MNRLRPRWPWWLGGFVALVALGLYSLVEYLGLDAACSFAIVQREPSPDWVWQADVQEATCPVGLFSTDVTDQVELRRENDPKRSVVVLGVDTGGNDYERLRLRWVTPRDLEVDIPYVTYLKVLTLHSQGIDVQLHAEGPDDPESRAKRFDWERSHGLPVF